MWKITFPNDDWTSSTCTCPVFQKQYYCKHWLGVAVRKKLITVSKKTTTILVKPSRGRPTDYETEELSQRPKGRPQKVGGALAIDNSIATASTTKRGRGHPKKRPLLPTAEAEENVEPPKIKRGRPRTRPLTPPPLPTKQPKRKPGRTKQIRT